MEHDVLAQKALGEGVAGCIAAGAAAQDIPEHLHGLSQLKAVSLLRSRRNMLTIGFRVKGKMLM